MGKQLVFFMLSEDEEEFLYFVKSTGNVVFYPYRSKETPFKILERLPKPFSTTYWGDIWLQSWTWRI